MSRIELMGESEGSYLFVYKSMEDMPERFRGKPSHRLAFIYSKEDGQEKCKGYNSFEAVLAHNPYWVKPTTQFSDDELERIALLLPDNVKLPVYYRRQITGIVLLKERKRGNSHDYAFAYTCDNNVPMDWGFMYTESEGVNVKYGLCRLDALYSHVTGWTAPEREFTGSEKAKIMELEVTGSYEHIR